MFSPLCANIGVMAFAACALTLLLSSASYTQVYAQTDPNEYGKVAILETAMGDIVIEFFPDDAPNHVTNFIKLAESGFYDGTIFHRIIPGFMIQGGDPNTIDGPPDTWGIGGPPDSVDAEFNDIEHDRGIVSMARSQNPNSAGSQFFIVHQDSNFLDMQYTVFGRVITDSSYDTLDAIASASTGAQDRPIDPETVEITSISIVDRSEVFDILDLLPPERTAEPPLFSPPPTTTTPSGAQIYDSKELGISFEAPAGWLLQEPGRMNPEAPDVVAVGQREDGGIPQVYIYIHDAEQHTLQEIVDIRTSEIRNILSEEDFATLTQQDTTVSGLSAHEIQVTESVTINNITTDVKLVEVLVYGDNDKYYVLSYANIPQNFDDSLPHFENVLATFEVDGMTASVAADDTDDDTGSVDEDMGENTDDAITDVGDDDAITDVGDDDAITDVGDDDATDTNTGGCLIATAAFGSELAPQVQTLRELRDNTVMMTQSGTAFMSGFNTLYYSFSPYVADMEREHPAFREAVRTFITPMIYSLSIMTMADISSDHDVITYGAIVIMLNVGLYIMAPAVLILVGIRAMRAGARLKPSTPAVP